ncbi:MAG TPA: SRPBCC family protein [Nitriliruptoraceae bacterium]|nr:SRPBCC family protein [Nitriliruptoraceae bacterium]
MSADVTATTSTQVSVTIDIPGERPSEVFAWLCDTNNHVDTDGSGHVVSPVGAETLTAKGDTFGMQMKWILPYQITNTVVEFEPDRRIAWRHFAGHRWRYELEATEGGTRVTESFDIGHVPSLARGVYGLAFGFPDAYARNLCTSLERLRDELAA